MTSSNPTAYEKYSAEAVAWAEPHLENLRHATDASVRFAEIAIKNVSYLNVGGLIALPVVINLLGASIKTDGLMILAIACGYFFGLAACVVTALAGFFAFARSAEAHDNFADSRRIDVEATYLASSQERHDELRHSSMASWQAANKKIRDYNFWRLIGIISLIVGFVAFMAATALGLYWYLRYTA